MKKTEFEKRIEEQQKFLEKIYKNYFINNSEDIKSNQSPKEQEEFLPE